MECLGSCVPRGVESSSCFPICKHSLTMSHRSQTWWPCSGTGQDDGAGGSEATGLPSMKHKDSNDSNTRLSMACHFGAPLDNTTS